MWSNAPNDHYGGSVAIIGNIIAVGSTSANAANADQGAVYLYEKPTNGWATTSTTSEIAP